MCRSFNKPCYYSLTLLRRCSDYPSVCACANSTRYELACFINPRRACAARVTVVGSVCLSVCLSVKSHLTFGASVRPENAVTYSAGNEGQKICGVFSETAPLQRSSTPSFDGHTYSRPFFLRKAARMRVIVFTTCGGGPKRPFLPSSCAELKVVVSFVSCHWSCLQARSVHNVMLLYR